MGILDEDQAREQKESDSKIWSDTKQGLFVGTTALVNCLTFLLLYYLGVGIAISVIGGVVVMLLMIFYVSYKGYF